MFKSNLRVEPPENFLEEYEAFKQIEVIAPNLLQTSKSRNSKLVTNPDDHFLLTGLFLLVSCIEFELMPPFIEYAVISIV